MHQDLIFNKKEGINPDEIFKATSLLYLEEALVNQEYEDAPELIRAARDFGAKKNEIRSVINMVVRGIRAGTENEAVPNTNDRLHFYEGE